jgi:hypothetical protein
MRQYARACAMACLVGLALMVLGSCASTSMVSSKKNPAYTGPELKRLMVIGSTADARVGVRGRIRS